MDIIKFIGTEFDLDEKYLKNIIKLIDDGNTIPFIARYRKELTGGLDDQKLKEVSERISFLRNLQERKKEILSHIEGQGNLTEEIKKSLLEATTISAVDDIYRPFRPKRTTKASIAKEKGLEGLAQTILRSGFNIAEVAKKYICEEKEISNVDQAIENALYIISEFIADRVDIRSELRKYIYFNGILKTVAVDDNQISDYQMYYNYNENVNRIANHRILAINRAEKEKIIRVSLEVEKNGCLNIIKKYLSEYIDSNNCHYMDMACEDGLDRLILPSIEREIRKNLTQRAMEKSIEVFSANLRQLLMQAPIKGYVIIGLDPAYRTGCKLCVIDENGKALDSGIIYPTPPHNKVEPAEEIILDMIKKYGAKIIAIGNGTASRESESFICNLIKKYELDLHYVIVSEAGASVYSASKIGFEEFPDYDVSIRSAFSIARRLQDPLAELVKIDTKSIGVGQYQHDMDKNKLDSSLDFVVESCVNRVGVNLNTASQSLLSKVSGVSNSIAKNIIEYRNNNGAFKSRKELLEVKKLGKKTYEQCAGFLRIDGADNVLDNTGVHPESYEYTKKLLLLCEYSLDDILTFNISDLKNRVEVKGYKFLSKELGIGVPTLIDIVDELLKPGRDPREELPKPVLKSDILDIKDLQIGDNLNGTVRNVVDFGAFIDIGVHHDGLVHISKICNHFIKHPLDVLNLGDVVSVKIIDIDYSRNKIGLSMLD